MLASPDANLPTAQWDEISNDRFAGGVFSVTDAQAGGFPRRFYKIASP
jgi:hypothetical protein